LQKVLARAGLASRREAEGWIRAGRITVNGEPATLGVRVAPSDQIRLDGRLIRQRETPGSVQVFLCHRSPGEHLQEPRLPAAEAGSETALAAEGGLAMLTRLPRRAGRRFMAISPMPRIDGGLELVTSDGELASQLQRCVRRLTSELSVRVHGELLARQLEGILSGRLDSGESVEVERCEPSGGEGSNRWYTFAARGVSGKQVRQLFERQGALVSRVLRTQLGPLTLDRRLTRGHFRALTPQELDSVLAATSDSRS
jgi:23S rRNA pseudouridine2605 synthase